MITLMDAIQALKPGAECSIRGNSYDGIEWLDKSQTKPTEDEVNAKLTELTNAYPMKLLREERNRLLQETDWRASSDLIISEEWKIYRQRLRDLPEGNAPDLNSDGSLDKTSVNWPTPPS
tara:strand:- start:45 stop:404 length:360 start_codon:yes stop_codon:yes gene_type:complete